MSRKSNYYAGKQLNSLYGGVAYTPPATLYFGFLTDTNDEDQRAAGTFTEVPFANGYARASVANNTTNFPDAVLDSYVDPDSGATLAAMIKHCTVDIQWPSATGAWGTIRGVAVFDGSGAGANMLEFAALETAQPVVPGNAPYFPAGTGLLVTER